MFVWITVHQYFSHDKSAPAGGLKIWISFMFHCKTICNFMQGCWCVSCCSSTVSCWAKPDVSVRKVVPTLISTSVEIYLSMAGAKQLSDTRFILVPAGAVRLAGVCSRHCIAMHRDACRGELQARQERRRSLQVPEVWLRRDANIVVKAISV
jgi:hypothetical protein